MLFLIDRRSLRLIREGKVSKEVKMFLLRRCPLTLTDIHPNDSATLEPTPAVLAT